MKEKEKKTGACSTSFPQTPIMKKSIFYKVLFGNYIPPKIIQITKMTKPVNYYRDNLERKHKKEVKKSRDKRGKSMKFRIVKFRKGCEIVLFSAALSSN